MPPQRASEHKVGARLRAAREKRGVSLRQISNSTRISVTSLEALERSDLSRLPGGIFTRAFIRAYAREVGLDPERTIEDFVTELSADSAIANSRFSVVEDGARFESSRKAATTAINLALLSVPIIGLVIYYTGPHTPAAPAALHAPVAEAVPLPPAPLREAAPSPPARVHLPEPTGLQMEIAPRATCWVSVTADGERVFFGLMAAGEKRAVTAKDQILVNVGDAAAFVYTLNGQPGRQLGAPGQVVSKRITLSNVGEFVSP
jgi:cytoskeleton protein RodZ